ncbi:unnamed protein product [Brassica napus]|uniref:(rape) hypothetical protein n=1 Tax=Brassica napus TaxID=3708 RepID=A0A816LZM1_BRANA|nr:unnamed protein product [Brassica napus]
MGRRDYDTSIVFVNKRIDGQEMNGSSTLFWHNLMRKGFTWKLECISSQVANEAVGSIRTLALFCAEIFFAFTIAAAAISHLISLSPNYSKATNAAASCTQYH